MPISLNHGPAGGNKSEKIFPQIEPLLKNIGSMGSFQVILPSPLSIHWYANQLNQNQTGFFTKNNLSTFSDFLKKTLKLNIDRFHMINDRQSRLLIRKILEESPKYFSSQKKYSPFIEKIRKTIIALKKTGIDLENYSSFEKSSSFQFKIIKEIIQKYDEQLSKNYFFDLGDLYHRTLSLLKEKNLKLPAELKYIFIDKIFPLDLAQREILKLLNKNFPDLKIIINFNFDFKQENIFSKAYEFLGQFSSTEIYHERINNPQISLDSYSDMNSELLDCVSKIKTSLAHRISSENIAIVLPQDQFYEDEIKYLLSKEKIPFHEHFQSRINQILNLENESLSELIEFSRNQEKSILNHQLNLEKSLQDFEEEWNHDLVLTETDRISSGILQKWKKDEINWISQPSLDQRNGIQLIPFELASHRNWDEIFILGFHHKNYPQLSHHHPLFQDEIWNHQDLREILEGSSYDQVLQEEKFIQTIYNSQKVHLSLAQKSWENKELEKSYFIDLISSDLLSENHHPLVEIDLNPDEKTSQYQIISKNNFSVTELEAYLQCPYKYYHRYILKIDGIEEEEIELKSLDIGIIIHAVLEKSLKSHLELFKKSIEDQNLEIDFFKKMDQILWKELQKTNQKISIEPHLLDHFQKKAQNVLKAYIKSELESLREGTKINIPQFFEWSFEIQNKDIKIKGKIDRIDLNQDLKTYSVIDYKTGNLISNSKIISGDSLQIPLYLIAVKENLLSDFQPSSGLLMGLGELGKNRGLIIKDRGENKILKRASISEDQWKNLIQIVKNKTLQISQNINQGKFDPHPIENSLCSFCDYQDICHYQA